MTKKTTPLEGLGGSPLVDRRKLFSTLGVAAAGVTAASLVPFKSSLAAAPAKVVFGKATLDRTENSSDVLLAFPAYAESIPPVYPRVSEEDVAEPVDHSHVA
jgi:hypothetical protein